MLSYFLRRMKRLCAKLPITFEKKGVSSCDTAQFLFGVLQNIKARFEGLDYNIIGSGFETCNKKKEFCKVKYEIQLSIKTNRGGVTEIIETIASDIEEKISPEKASISSIHTKNAEIKECKKKRKKKRKK